MKLFKLFPSKIVVALFLMFAILLIGVMIEKDRELIAAYGDGVLFVEGDVNEDGVLLEAGIQRPQYLVATLPDDVLNLFVVLSARQMNKTLFIINRTS